MSFQRVTSLCFFCLVTFLFVGCASKSNDASYPANSSHLGANSSGKIIDSPNMHRATMRPYSIDGKTYHPTMVSVGDYFSGVASWYGKDFHGKKTSNGEVYNMNDMTAAHKTLPMNTMLKVTNLKNNQSVVVRVNDRGPFVGSRIIDLSYNAATRLDLVGHGTGPVGIEVIGFSGVIASSGTPQQSIEQSDYFVQIGAFKNKDGAYRYAKSNSDVNNRYNAIVKEGVFNNDPIYRVWLKGFASEDEAGDFISKGSFKGAFIVKE